MNWTAEQKAIEKAIPVDHSKMWTLDPPSRAEEEHVLNKAKTNFVYFNNTT